VRDLVKKANLFSSQPSVVIT